VANPDPSLAKRELRALLRRAQHRPADPADASARIRAAILAWLDEHSGIGSVAAFAALPDEPLLLPLLTARPDLLWAFPKVAGDGLKLHTARVPGDLVPGAFRIPEPASAAPLVDPGNIDLFLCPGLAFDSAGARLGRGAGHYDRLLSAARASAVRCGVAFATRFLPAIPTEAHDIRMHAVVTEDGWHESTAPGIRACATPPQPT
jgi:5-formyltetrahydrofolate cyclo-ligase